MNWLDNQTDLHTGIVVSVLGWLMLAVCVAWGVTRKKQKAPRKPDIVFNRPGSTDWNRNA